MNTKTCTVCQAPMSVHRHKWCIRCAPEQLQVTERARMKRYYARHRAICLARAKLYRETHRARIRAADKARYWRRKASRRR
jgi:hypothetical protein